MQSVIDRNGNPTNVPEVDLRSQGAYSDWSRFLINGIVKVRSATFVSVFIPVQNIYNMVCIKNYTYYALFFH